MSDRAASEEFYDTVLAVLGVEKTHSDEWYAEWNDFFLAATTAEQPATRRLHIGFAAATRELVEEFWRVGTQAGYRDDGAPGARPQYSEDYYGAFLVDPDGNSAEAVHHDDAAGRGIDHLWIGVDDVAAAKRFYETIAPHAGLRLSHEQPDRVHFAAAESSFGCTS